ncbi:MAG TPA: magnesium/cobalt transporter CorA [Lacipirellulaceae bacterium]|jgi:magnesium transporter|nr:magnesium/cobalt transporter CorA [Lacipirellulaceae bacterium]
MGNHRRSRRWTKMRVRRRAKPGAKPGTLVIAPEAPPTTIRVIAFDKDRFIEQEIQKPSELNAIVGRWPIVWVDVVGLGSEDKLRGLAEVFHIHPLALEDVVHVHQRAKVETFDQHLFCVMRIPDPSNVQLTEQFSLFLGRKYVLTFQERPGDCFDLIRASLRHAESTTRLTMGADYLAYRLIDASVDAYFPVVEHIGDHLDNLDDAKAFESESAFLELHTVKSELLVLRRAIWPLRDALSELRSETTPYICDATRVYLRDCYDHVVQLLDLLESYRDISGDVRDFYLVSISNRMNEIMKTLTVISTIFLPLSFIASIYGMNFNTEISKWNMPELNWRFGYLFALGVMAVVAIGMLLNFKWRGWLRGDPTRVVDTAPHSAEAHSLQAHSVESKEK